MYLITSETVVILNLVNKTFINFIDNKVGIAFLIKIRYIYDPPLSPFLSYALPISLETLF